MRRRTVLRGGLGGAAAAVLGGWSLAACGGGDGDAASPPPQDGPVRVLSFAPVAKSLFDRVSVPEGYTALPIYALGDPLTRSAAPSRNDGTDLDFDQRAGDHHDGMAYFGLDADGTGRDPAGSVLGRRLHPAQAHRARPLQPRERRLRPLAAGRPLAVYMGDDAIGEYLYKSSARRPGIRPTPSPRIPPPSAASNSIGAGCTRVSIDHTRADASALRVDTWAGRKPDPGSLRRFLVGPVECELTGCAETPDGRTVFANVQNPGEVLASVADILDPSKYTSHGPGNAGYQAEAGNRTSQPRPATIAITKDDGGRVGQ